MSEEQKPNADLVAAPEPQQDVDPRTFLAGFPNAPSSALIDQWKAGACNGRVKIYSPDASGKRAFVLRGLSAREMEAVENDVPQNTLPEKVQPLLQAAAVSKATLWTSVTSNNKLAAEDLRNFGAGLAPALYEIVAELSDFAPPQLIQRLSADL